MFRKHNLKKSFFLIFIFFLVFLFFLMFSYFYIFPLLGCPGVAPSESQASSKASDLCDDLHKGCRYRHGRQSVSHVQGEWLAADLQGQNFGGFAGVKRIYDMFKIERARH